MRLIRQRLLIARLCQKLYQDLVHFLTPGVEPDCLDTRVNKALQPVILFKVLHNLVNQACQDGDTHEKRAGLIKERLLPCYQTIVLPMILPSLRGLELAIVPERLSRQWQQLSPGEPLADLVAEDSDDAKDIFLGDIEYLLQDQQRTKEIESLIADLKHKSPWRVLQDVSDHAVILQAAHADGLPPRARVAMIQRLKELASTPDEHLAPIFIQLDQYLNGEHRMRPSDTATRVEQLLSEADDNQDADLWRGPILQYRAKHLLSLNKFDEALPLFRSALEACRDHNYGTARGEIARDTLALELANQCLIPGNHEKYFRNMQYFGMHVDAEHVEDVTIPISKYFWDNLYKPYPGVTNECPKAMKDVELMVDRSMDLVFHGDWAGLDRWMKEDKKILGKRLRMASGDTILMLWIKAQHKTSSSHAIYLPPNLASEKKQSMDNWHEAIRRLATAFPKLLDFADFKAQTPLMMAANNSDLKLVETVLNAGANPDLQDYRGRTALHAATASRSIDCVKAILASNPDTTIVAHEGRSNVLHIAASIGDANIVEVLAQHDPRLVSGRNAANLTPAECARDILIDVDAHRRWMGSGDRQRRTGAKDEYEHIAQILNMQ